MNVALRVDLRLLLRDLRPDPSSRTSSRSTPAVFLVNRGLRYRRYQIRPSNSAPTVTDGDVALVRQGNVQGDCDGKDQRNYRNRLSPATEGEVARPRLGHSAFVDSVDDSRNRDDVTQ